MEVPTGAPPPIPEPGRIETPNVAGVPPPPKQRKSGIRNAVIIVVLILVLVIMARACVGGANNAQRESGSQGGGTSESPKEEAQSPPPTEEPDEAPVPITLSGSGQMATDLFELESCLAIFKLSYQGDRNFIVHLLDENGSQVGQSVVNVIGSFDGSQAMQAKAGQHVLDVQASGPWNITIEQPRFSSAPQTTSFNGAGQTASEPFRLSKGLTTFNMNHQGSRNFIVHLLDKNGAKVGGSLVNEIGPFEGSKAIRVPKDDIYLFDVQADGPWTIQVE